MRPVVAVVIAVAIALAAAGCRSKGTSRPRDGWHMHCDRLRTDIRSWCQIPYHAAQALVAVYIQELRKKWYFTPADMKEMMAAQLPENTVFTVELAEITRVRVIVDCDKNVQSRIGENCRDLYKKPKTFLVDPSVGEIREDRSDHVPDYRRLKRKCEMFFDDDPPVVKAWCNIDSYSGYILSTALTYNDTKIEQPWELRHYALYMDDRPSFTEELFPHGVVIILQDTRCRGLEENCFKGLPAGDLYSAGYLFDPSYPSVMRLIKFGVDSEPIKIRLKEHIADVLAVDYRPVDIFYKPFVPPTPSTPVHPENSIRGETGPKGTGSQDADGAKGKPRE